MSSAVDTSYVLIVDDDPFALKLMSQILKSKGYVYRAAASGLKAQEILEETGAEALLAVITDYRMPEMTGLEFVEWLQGQDPSLGVVMMTAEGDKSLVTASLRFGVSDFLDKPIDSVVLLDALDRAIERTKTRRSLQRAKSAVDEVSQFHQSILGLKNLRAMPGVKLFYRSLEEAGGDLVSVLSLGGGKWALIGADVSGHDLKAAFLSAYFQGVSHAMLRNQHTISEVLAFMNRFIALEWNVSGGEGVFSIQASLAVAAVTYDSEQGRIGGISMGFPLPLLVTEERGVERLGEDGPPLGWSDTPDFLPVVRQGVTDGWVFLWSDGLYDFALNSGINAMTMAYCLLTSRQQKVVEGLKMPDDLFVLGYQLKAKTEEPTLVYFDRMAGNQLMEIDLVQQEWERDLKLLFPSIDVERLSRLLLLLRESFLNALEHGAQGKETLFASMAWFWNAQESVLKIRVDDPGKGHEIDLSGTPEAVSVQIESTIGGLFFIRALSKSVRTERNGATLHLEFSMSD